MKFDFEGLETQLEADWPVRVNVPQDGGKVKVQDLSVRFRLTDDEELKEFGTGIEAQKSCLRAVVVGFGKKEDQPFTPELFDKMIARGYVRQALTQAYAEFSLGIVEKN